MRYSLVGDRAVHGWSAIKVAITRLRERLSAETPRRAARFSSRATASGMHKMLP
jgi:hypothetical protein